MHNHAYFQKILDDEAKNPNTKSQEFIRKGVEQLQEMEDEAKIEFFRPRTPPVARVNTRFDYCFISIG